MWERRGARGAGESFMRSGRRCCRHSQSPRAAQSRRERSERVSKRVEGAPGRCLRSDRSSPPRSGNPEKSERQPKSAGAEQGEPSAEAPVPLHRLLCQPGSARPPPHQPRACSPGPSCPRDGLRACKRLAASLLFAQLSGSLPPTDRSRLRAPPAQAGEVSCAPRLAREPATGRAKAARRRDHGLGLG